MLYYFISACHLTGESTIEFLEKDQAILRLHDLGQRLLEYSEESCIVTPTSVWVEGDESDVHQDVLPMADCTWTFCIGPVPDSATHYYLYLPHSTEAKVSWGDYDLTNGQRWADIIMFSGDIEGLDIASPETWTNAGREDGGLLRLWVEDQGQRWAYLTDPVDACFVVGGIPGRAMFTYAESGGMPTWAACYFEGDPSDLSDEDRATIEAWVDSLELPEGACIHVSGSGSWFTHFPAFGLACNVTAYVILAPVK